MVTKVGRKHKCSSTLMILLGFALIVLLFRPIGYLFRGGEFGVPDAADASAAATLCRSVDVRLNSEDWFIDCMYSFSGLMTNCLRVEVQVSHCSVNIKDDIKAAISDALIGSSVICVNVEVRGPQSVTPLPSGGNAWSRESGPLFESFELNR